MIAIISGLTKKRVIGKNNDLPWNIPEDLKHFATTTKGAVVIMGRKTFESMGSRALPKRVNIIVSSKYSHEGIIVANSLESAIDKAKQYDRNIFLIGGRKIFEEGLKYADTMILSWIKQDYEGDVYFPEFGDEWQEVSREDHKDFEVVTYSKRSA